MDSTKHRRRISSIARSEDGDHGADGDKRARSSSPFRFRMGRRPRSRASSPDQIGPLTTSDVESDAEPRRTPTGGGGGGEYDEDDAWSGDEDGSGSGYDDGSDMSDEFDPLTKENTEANSRVLLAADRAPEGPEDEEGDPLGEGVNVVIPPEPYFPSTLNGASPAARRSFRRKKSMLARPDPLELNTGRPVFARDRCTIVMRHGDPGLSVAESGRRPRKYVVASDISEESRYAVEWGIGTVLRDGDEMLIVNVNENDAKG
jgi:hypothetical protein